MVLRLAVTRDETGRFEHFQVLGDGGLTDGERFGQFQHPDLARAQSGEDRATRRVCEGGECPVEFGVTETSHNQKVMRWMG